MTEIVIKNRNIHDVLSGKVITSVQSDRTTLFVKAKGDVGVFINFHNGPHIHRIIGHREFMSSPMYGFAEVSWGHWLRGHKVLATLTDGKHLVFSKVGGTFAWIGWDVRQGPHFVKQDAHVDMFGHGLEGIAEMFAKMTYKRRQV